MDPCGIECLLIAEVGGVRSGFARVGFASTRIKVWPTQTRLPLLAPLLCRLTLKGVVSLRRTWKNVWNFGGKTCPRLKTPTFDARLAVNPRRYPVARWKVATAAIIPLERFRLRIARFLIEPRRPMKNMERKVQNKLLDTTRFRLLNTIPSARPWDAVASLVEKVLSFAQKVALIAIERRAKSILLPNTTKSRMTLTLLPC
mmetsp:Transcript_27282/g.57153  ORF Transcript_27282/g.57153 Transcript_27282/m.57153 type:complete len:201 (-) Transcript_27282:320-922(-)